MEILRHLEVPVMNSENLMRLFDLSGRGHVSFQELVTGITSMLEAIFRASSRCFGSGHRPEGLYEAGALVR